jgi:HEAT repeat protein
MGKRRYRQVNELLQRLRSADPETRREAVHWLGRMRDPRIRAALIGALNDAHPRVRAAALLGLWRGENPEPAPETAALLSDPNDDVRAFAAMVAPDLVGRGAAPALIGLLDDPCGRVRSAAVTSLGKLGDEPSLEALAARATQDEDAYTRYQAAEALLHLGDARGREALERMSEAGDAPDSMSVESFREEVSQLLAESDGSG